MATELARNRQNIIQTISEYGRQLFGFIRSRVSSNEDAEDILQDVWYQLSAIPEVEAIDSMSGWLHRVARNKITDRFRKKKPELLDDLGFTGENGETTGFLELLMADNHTPETEHLRQMFWEELQSALRDLPENQRQAFVWNELEDRSFQEIADETGVNIKTLISRKRYAVKYLRERLQTLYNDIINY